MKRIIILLAAVSLLCGCMNLKDYYPYPSAPTPSSTTASSAASSTSTAASSTSSLPEGCLCCSFYGDEWDECIYDAAIEDRDFSLCERIEGRLLSSVCLAAEKGDAKICGLVEESEVRDKCYFGVAVSKKDANVCDRISLRNLKGSCYLRIARERDDRSICDRIDVATLRDICRGRSCRLQEVSADMIGYVDRSDFIEVSISSENCAGKIISAAFDTRYLSMINQSKTRFDLSNGSVSFRFKCNKAVNDTLIRLKAGDVELEKKASCGTAKPPLGCELSFLDEGSVLDSFIGMPVYLAFSAENCKNQEVSYSVKPAYLRFTSWSFNGVARGNRSNRTGTDDERIVLGFVCNESFGWIQLKASVGEKELIKYATCREKPLCRLRVSEEDSVLDARVGEDVLFTVFAIDCRYEEMHYSGEGGWLKWVNASRSNVSENTERIRVSYLCKRASDYPLYVSVAAGGGEALGYAYCRP